MSHHAHGVRSASGADDWRLGYPAGPTPDRWPGEEIHPMPVLGRPPMVILNRPLSGTAARLVGIAGRVWVALAALIWIGIPGAALVTVVVRAIFGQ